jgi:hypothetical protein
VATRAVFRLGGTRAGRRNSTGGEIRRLRSLVLGILLVLPFLFVIRAATNSPAGPTSEPDLANLASTLERVLPAGPARVSSNESGYYFWYSGLPPNVSATFVFGQFGPQGGWFTSAAGKDGFDGGGGPLRPGVYDLYVQAAPGFIPVTASATYFVSAPEMLNVSVSFVPAQPCYQVFTEVGLPQGTEWWAIGVGGVAFFANNSVIDTTGCGGLQGVTIGSSNGYQLVAYAPSAYYPSGAAIPVFFAPPPSSSAGQLPGDVIVSLVILVGVAVSVAFFVGRRRRGGAHREEQPGATVTLEGNRRD